MISKLSVAAIIVAACVLPAAPSFAQTYCPQYLMGQFQNIYYYYCEVCSTNQADPCTSCSASVSQSYNCGGCCANCCQTPCNNPINLPGKGGGEKESPKKNPLQTAAARVVDQLPAAATDPMRVEHAEHDHISGLVSRDEQFKAPSADYTVNETCWLWFRATDGSPRYFRCFEVVMRPSLTKTITMRIGHQLNPNDWNNPKEGVPQLQASYIDHGYLSPQDTNGQVTHVMDQSHRHHHVQITDTTDGREFYLLSNEDLP